MVVNYLRELGTRTINNHWIMLYLLLFISLFFTFIPTVIYPPSHKILRDKAIFMFMVIVAILIAITTGFLFNSTLTETQKINCLVSLSPITFLILYKEFDNISLSKYGRNIYFTMKYGSYISDRETSIATCFEYFLQMILCSIPFFWIGIGILMLKQY